MSGASPAVVALGGGHGLLASLSALRRLTGHLTAVVTVADDGGSSGRLRADLPWLLPPGDLRMALCALAADDPASQSWAALLQQRFDAGDLAGHPVGNLLLAGLLQQETSPVAALARLGAVVGAVGTVLPLSLEPVGIEADVELPGGRAAVVRGQVAVATTGGRVRRVRLIPAEPPVSEEVLTAVRGAAAVVLGPGSLFTSQLPHLLTPALAAALRETARIVLILNLVPQPGETEGLDPAGHLEALLDQAAWLQPAALVADETAVPPGSPARERLERAAARLGSDLLVRPLAVAGQPGVHDVGRLASALGEVLAATVASGGDLGPGPGVEGGGRLRQDGAVPTA